MAYSEYLADRVRQRLINKGQVVEKKMMGGLIFMVNEKMCCGIHIDKKYGDTLLMAKIGVEAYGNEIQKDVCLPMDFTGRPMKGFIFVTPEGVDREDDLEYWINLAVNYNKLLLLQSK